MPIGNGVGCCPLRILLDFCFEFFLLPRLVCRLNSTMSADYVLHPFHSAVKLQIVCARDLNERRLAAGTASPGPALVIAGAGSGRTRTLTYRVPYLLEQGIPADRILLLTFPNKAAAEMMR